MFERDIHQTRVKNSSLCVQYFSAQARAIRFIYFLLERACQDAGDHRILFLISYFFREKIINQEKSLFFKQLVIEIIKIFSQERQFWIKNHIISERSEDGLSSYVFISILKFLTKIDFFWGGGGAKKHGTVYFLMFSIHSIIRVVLYGSLLASNIYWKYFSKILKNSIIKKFWRWYIYVPPGLKGLKLVG